MASFSEIQRALDGPHGDNATLYAQTESLLKAANFPESTPFAKKLMLRFLDRCDELNLPPPHYEVAISMLGATASLYAAERLTDTPPNPALYGRHGHNAVLGRMRDQLLKQQRKAADPAATLAALSNAIIACFIAITRHLPPLAQGCKDGDTLADSTTGIPLIDLLPNIGSLLEDALKPFTSPEAKDLGLFSWLLAVVKQNTDDITEHSRAKRPPRPTEYDGTSREIAHAYLGTTPIEKIFLESHVPFAIPEPTRFEHAQIIGGIGHGKTQLLQTLMLADFDHEARPAVVAIDSQRDMIRTLTRLARFDPALDDRLIILDPSDYEWPLRLNIFDIPRERFARMKPGAREQMRAGIIEMYDYIFADLLDAETTQKQSVVFRYLAALMLEVPDATIQTMRQLLEDPSPFQLYIDRLTGTTRAFFENEFKDKSFYQTRKQILRRLYGILSNPVFERMFSYPRNGFDMKAALDGGKIILINTAKDVLKSQASAMFGRYCIALIMQAVLERAAEEQEQRRPAFVYIDEAAEYFDQNIDTLLIQARKYKVGITFAHQHLHQLKAEFRSSVMTTAATRFAGGVSDEDARALKSDMRTTPEFLLSMKKRDRIDTQFACYVRNLTSHAVKITLPFLLVETEPTMSTEAHAALLARNRAAVAAPFAEAQAHIEASTKAVNLSDDPDQFADRY